MLYIYRCNCTADCLLPCQRLSVEWLQCTCHSCGTPCSHPLIRQHVSCSKAAHEAQSTDSTCDAVLHYWSFFGSDNTQRQCQLCCSHALLHNPVKKGLSIAVAPTSPVQSVECAGMSTELLILLPLLVVLACNLLLPRTAIACEAIMPSQGR